MKRYYLQLPENDLEAPNGDLQLHPWGISCLVMEPEEKADYPSRNDLLWKDIIVWHEISSTAPSHYSFSPCLL